MFLNPILLAFLLAISTSATPITTPTTIPTFLARQATITTTLNPASISDMNFLTTNYITIAGQTDAYVTRAGQTIAIAVPTCIQTITPDKNGYVPPGTCHALYDYYPSFAAAVVASVGFGVLVVAHVVQGIKYKKAFTWVLITGTLWEFSGFLTRAFSTLHQQSVTLLLISQLLVLLAPLWVNAFAYMVLARLIHFYSPSFSILHIPIALLSTIFVALDFISFIIQIIGGSWAGPTSPAEEQMKGIHIYMSGIGLQQFFIIIFLFIAFKFHREMTLLNHSSPSPGNSNAKAKVNQCWKRLLWTLYASLGFISIRILFRLVEFSGGKGLSNSLPFHEGYFYALEATPMFLAVACFNVWHPGMVLLGPESKLPGIKETFWKGKGKENGKRGREVGDSEGKEDLVGRYEML